MCTVKLNKYLAFFLASIIAFLFCLFILPTSAFANPGISLAPFESIKADVAAGETITHQMKLQLGEQAQAMDMVVDIMGFGSSPDGLVQGTEAAQDNTPYSARRFITIDLPSFHLEPGQAQDILATINIPQDVGNGGRYAVINIHQDQPTGTGPVGSISAFNIPVVLTIKGTNIIHTGEISELITSEAVSGKPVDIFTTFQNTGNHHFKVKGEVIISNSQAEVLDIINIAPTTSPIIPTMSRQLKATFIPKVELVQGIYSVKSRVMLEDGTVLAEARGSFQTEKPYVPPPTPVSLLVIPSIASVLQTEDGRISINFPQGAVINQVTVSLNSYPLEKLPTPPADFKLATTCFCIDGLTGLLAKKATITVKYNAADLEKTGGDASKLMLAQWSEATSQWLVLKTTVDKEAMTLTTSTDQLSIFAVMVGQHQPRTNYALIGTIVLVVVAVSVTILIIKKRKSYS